MIVWVTCTSCIGGNGKRATFHSQKPDLSQYYKPNPGAHGKWNSLHTLGWHDSTPLLRTIEIGECKQFEIVEVQS